MEIGDRKEMKQNGIDYLIKQGYKNLSSKTFISDIDLEKFLNKDFTNINKTRALGFIQILEREYDVDLEELRAAYREHEGSLGFKKPETLFIEKPNESELAWKKYLPFIAGALAIFGLVFYLFRPSVEVGQTPEPLVQQSEENKSIIDEAQKNIEKLEQNKSKASDLEKEKNVSKPSVVSPQSIDDDLDLDKVVLQMIQDRNPSMKENDIDLNLETSVKTVEKQAKQNEDKEKKQQEQQRDANQKAKQEVKQEVKQEEANQKENQDKSVVTTVIAPVSVPAVNKPKVKQIQKEVPKKKKITQGGLYIRPTQKAWVGVIYLDNFTKKDFLIRNKLPLDSSRDQLIVVGHGHFKIFNKTYSVKFRGKGPVRFIYRDGELMEISKKEFKKSSAGVVW